MLKFSTLVLVAMAVVWVCADLASATKIVMKDGTVYQGTVIHSGDSYWIKSADGESHTVAAADVDTVTEDGDASGTPDAAAGAGGGDTADASALFKATVNRANASDTAVGAVAIWQEFIDKHADSPDLDRAKTELDHWKSLAGDGAEKINGKWIGGDDRQKIVDQANALMDEGADLLEQKQTLKAVDKLQQAVKIYPNSFETNFLLADISFIQQHYDVSQRYYQIALKLNPDSLQAENNLAVATYFNKQFELGIEEFEKALEIQDDKAVAQNLVTAIALAPPRTRGLSDVKPAMDAALLEAAKYNIDGPLDALLTLPPPIEGAKDGKGDGSKGGANHAGDLPPSLVWSGSGFLISDDGLIITNRHVAKGSKNLLVTLGDKQYSADVVVIDDEQDLALIKIKPPDKVRFVHLSKADKPNDGADCVVMGFPMIDRLGADIKITRGIVSSSAGDEGNGADIMTDAKVNPGNSGGPIVDKFGNVMGIVSMKSLATEMEDSYGIGISAGHIRKFLDKNHVDVMPGSEEGGALSTEDIAAKVKQATVCIMATK